MWKVVVDRPPSTLPHDRRQGNILLAERESSGGRKPVAADLRRRSRRPGDVRRGCRDWRRGLRRWRRRLFRIAYQAFEIGSELIRDYEHVRRVRLLGKRPSLHWRFRTEVELVMAAVVELRNGRVVGMVQAILAQV